uniref:pyruvate kinase n=1 Tax=Aegilops tauschii subsp. strangulata TaxID=200361 RepID=A0A453K015_AEGTS
MAGKPAVVTHVVDSMTDNLRPARAEATDVANAVLDESNESSDSESSDSEVFIYLPISKWKLHHLIAFLIIFLPDFTMFHFIFRSQLLK